MSGLEFFYIYHPINTTIYVHSVEGELFIDIYIGKTNQCEKLVKTSQQLHQDSHGTSTHTSH